RPSHPPHGAFDGCDDLVDFHAEVERGLRLASAFVLGRHANSPTQMCASSCITICRGMSLTGANQFARVKSAIQYRLSTRKQTFAKRSVLSTSLPGRGS